MTVDPTTPDPQRLVDLLRRAGSLSDPRVDAAFSAVPRHRFLPDAPLDTAYADLSVPVRYDGRGTATLSETMPSMVARLLAQSSLREGHNVLQIGTGTGYVAALMQHIVGPHGNVTTLEIERDIAEVARTTLTELGYASVNVVHVDGAAGYAPRAAYDRIVANVGVWDIPPAWKRQLKPQGRITAPIWLDGVQLTTTFTLDEGVLLSESATPSAFVYIRGMAAMPAVQRRVGSAPLTLISDAVDRLDSAMLHTLLSQDADDSNRLSMTMTPADFWYGLVPFMAVNEPEKDVFALYTIDLGGKAYGMEGEGFAIFTPASACFVPYFGGGATHCFAGADAFLELDAKLHDWQAAGRPGLDRLHLDLIPHEHGIAADVPGRVYARRDHFLHAWIAPPDPA